MLSQKTRNAQTLLVLVWRLLIINYQSLTAGAQGLEAKALC